MSFAEYLSWRELNDSIPVVGRARSPCEDCTVAYRFEMERQARCARALGKDVGLGAAPDGGGERILNRPPRARSGHRTRAVAT
jgi:hypothetical protein